MNKAILLFRLFYTPLYLQEAKHMFLQTNSLGENLKELRLSVRLTQRQIAPLLHVDRSTYSYYELGRTEPNIGALKCLSALYGVSIDEIVGNKKEPKNKRC